MDSLFLTKLFEYFPELNEMKSKTREELIGLIQSTRKGNMRHIWYPNDRIFAFDVNNVLRKIHRTKWQILVKPFFKKTVPCADYRLKVTDGWTYTERFEQFLKFYSESIKNKSEELITIKREIQINFEQSIKFLKFILECIEGNNIQLYNKTIIPKNKLKNPNELLNKRDALVYTIDNTIEKTYREGKTKRLFMVSESNLQTCPSEIRKVILSGLGYYDYDIKNCHFTIAWQLLEDLLEPSEEEKDFCCNPYILGKPKKLCFPEIYKMVQDSAKYRFDLANEWCVSVSKAKEILTSLLNGGAQSWRSKCFKNIQTIVPEQERQHQNLILKSNIYKELKRECKDIKERLFYKFGKKYKTIKKKNFTSYLIQDNERKILDVIINNYSTELLMHDGWVLNQNIEPKILEQLIEDKTGFKVEIKRESLDFIL